MLDFLFLTNIKCDLTANPDNVFRLQLQMVLFLPASLHQAFCIFNK